MTFVSKRDTKGKPGNRQGVILGGTIYLDSPEKRAEKTYLFLNEGVLKGLFLTLHKEYDL